MEALRIASLGIVLTVLVVLATSSLATQSSASTVLTVTVAGFPECSDGIDNDADTFIDYPDDADCTSAADTLEGPSLPPSGGGGGGGGGGGEEQTNTSRNYAVFRGIAYPGSKVTLLKDGQRAAATTASPNGSFEITLRKLAPGTYTFSVYGTDTDGVLSSAHSFSVTLSEDVTNVISGIFIPPTIRTDKKEVRQGDLITILGKTTPAAEVTVFVNSAQQNVRKVNANTDGHWLLRFDTTILELGGHSAQSRATLGEDVSPLSVEAEFKVGTQNILWEEEEAAPTNVCKGRTVVGDVTCDTRVNLVDYSILAYWFKRVNPPKHVDMNGDGLVDIRDFSILAFHWTG